jgi:CheY-like chemotaxis protein
MTLAMTALTDETAQEDDEAVTPTSILVVDDDASIRTSLRRLLQALGYEAVGAANAGEALQKAGEMVPDLIIMDLHLAQESGLDTARAIKSVAALKRIPIIAMTSSSIDNEELRSVFQRILRKPFAALEIQALLGSFFYR